MKYLLNKKPLGARNRFKVTIVGDSNDADYITTTRDYSKDVFEKYVVDGLIELSKYFGRHKLEEFDNGKWGLDLPYGDIGVCHTLHSLNVEYIDEHGEIWDVELVK